MRSPELEPSAMLAQFDRASIGYKKYLFSSYDFEAGLMPIRPSGEMLKEFQLFTPGETANLTPLSEYDWKQIWSMAESDFPSLWPAKLAVSLSIWYPSKLHLFGDIVEEIQKQRGEEHIARVTIRNAGNGESGNVTVTFPKHIQPVDEEQRWNVSAKMGQASIASMKPGEEVLLILTSPESFQFSHEDIDLQDKGSFFRKRWTFWLGIGIIVVVTALVVFLDILFARRPSKPT